MLFVKCLPEVYFPDISQLNQNFTNFVVYLDLSIMGHSNRRKDGFDPKTDNSERSIPIAEVLYKAL